MTIWERIKDLFTFKYNIGRAHDADFQFGRDVPKEPSTDEMSLPSDNSVWPPGSQFGPMRVRHGLEAK